MTIDHRMRFDEPVDRLVELLCSERYSLETQGAREDVVDVRFQLGLENEDNLHFTVHLTTYGRKKTGRLDRHRTEASRVVYRYERPTRVLHWHHEGEEGAKVEIFGTTRFTEIGGRTQLDRRVIIKVKVPIVGRAIAKIIEQKMRSGFDRLEQQIHRMLKSV